MAPDWRSATLAKEAVIVQGLPECLKDNLMHGFSLEKTSSVDKATAPLRPIVMTWGAKIVHGGIKIT